MGHVALPAVGTIQGDDQTGGVKLVQSRDAPRLLVDRVNAVDTAFVVPGPQVQRLFQLVVNPLRMLDHEAVHVQHPQGAVRPGLQGRWSKPDVVRGKELRLLFVGATISKECHAVGLEDSAMNYVVHGIIDKQVSREVRAKQVVSIDHNSSQRRPTTRLAPAGVWTVLQVAVRNHAACGIHGSVRCHVDPTGGRSHVWISPDIVIGQGIEPGRIAVVAAEPVAPVIAIGPELRLARLGIDNSFVGPEAQIAAADAGFFSRLQRPDRTAAISVRGMDPVVQTPSRVIDTVLLVALPEAGE